MRRPRTTRPSTGLTNGSTNGPTNRPTNGPTKGQTTRPTTTPTTGPITVQTTRPTSKENPSAAVTTNRLMTTTMAESKTSKTNPAETQTAQLSPEADSVTQEVTSTTARGGKALPQSDNSGLAQSVYSCVILYAYYFWFKSSATFELSELTLLKTSWY